MTRRLTRCGNGDFSFEPAREFLATAGSGLVKDIIGRYQMNGRVTIVIFVLGVLLPLLGVIFVLVGLK